MTDTMDTNTDRHRFIVQMQQRAATGGLVIHKGAPVKFRHTTGSVVLTRDPTTYRRLPGWTELPFDTSSPVPPPRRP